MPTIDLSSFAKRNIWPLPSGELAVRPGIREIDTLSSDDVVAAFSVKSFTNQETWHYVFHEQTAPYKLFLTVYDEDFDGLPLQTLLTDAASRPDAITHAVVFDQLVISSPDFSTLFGYTGGTVFQATAPSELTASSLDPIAVPRGICTSWGGRCVIANGTMVWFSESVLSNGLGMAIGFSTFSGNPVPGTVYGLHTNAGGDLIVVTDSGVFGLPPDASAAREEVAPIWNKWNDHTASGYGQSCAARGEVFALTRRGFRGLTLGESPEHLIDEPRVNTTVTSRIAHDNYQMGAILAGADGPVIVHPDGDAFMMVDMGTGLLSWWTFTHSGEDGFIKGVLQDPYGEAMLVTKKSVYAIGGNFDGAIASTSENATKVVGAYIGSMPVPPDTSPVLRRVDYGTDSNGTVTISFSGKQRTATPVVEDNEEYSNASTAWDTTTTTARRMKSVRTRWAVRSDDLGMEIAVEDCLSRAPAVLTADFKGPGRRRP